MEVSWEAPEFEYRQKKASWYWGSMLVTLVVLAIAVWQWNFVFAVFVILAEIMVMVWADREPRTLRFSVAEKGLAIEGVKFYPYADMATFSLNREVSSAWDELVLRFGRATRPRLRVSVPKDKSEAVRSALAAALAEVEPEHSFIDNLERFFGF